MNQQQKNHVRNRLREIANAAIEALPSRNFNMTDADKAQLGLSERYIKWPNVSEMKAGVMRHMDYQYSHRNLAQEIFGRKEWKAWEAELEARNKDIRQARDKARNAIEAEKARVVDQVMLGDAADALDFIANFEAEVKYLVKSYAAL